MQKRNVFSFEKCTCNKRAGVQLDVDKLKLLICPKLSDITVSNNIVLIKLYQSFEKIIEIKNVILERLDKLPRTKLDY